MRIALYQVDAFTPHRFAGNPAAVMLFETFPSEATMLAIAAENNLAETAFLVRDGDDYRLRWFTPKLEVPLCGHATLASAAVVMERLEPARTRVVFHTASGALTVARKQDGYAMDLPARPSTRVATPPALSAALGVEPVEVWVNAFHYMAVVDGADVLRALAPGMRAVAALDRLGVIATAVGDAGFDFVSRYFAPAKGIPEDPVTGSAHCTLAPYWGRRLGKEELLAFQASERGGQVVCRPRGDRVELLGQCAFYLEGHVEL